MRKSLIAGNWKMHGSMGFVTELLSTLKAGATHVENNIELVVFPPFVFLEKTQSLLTDTPIRWGAQNVYSALEGAYTGEISPSMLKEFNCSYVIVGHSERRHLFGETSEQVAEKFILSGKSGLKPILCVGETKAERDAGKTFEIISKQLQPILNSEEGLAILANDAVIAYEPVWAIGTGVTATPDQAQAVHAFIRQEVTKIDKSLAEKLRILYGGSLKPENAETLFAMPDIDGGLIGGASLNAQEFLDIAKLCR